MAGLGNNQGEWDRLTKRHNVDLQVWERNRGKGGRLAGLGKRTGDKSAKWQREGNGLAGDKEARDPGSVLGKGKVRAE